MIKKFMHHKNKKHKNKKHKNKNSVKDARFLKKIKIVYVFL